MAKGELDRYKAKRDFNRTPEPSGGAAPPGQAPTFVVQKHAATALHYDFRLQVGNVMPSWAVPKGPSHNPKVRRLAVQTEDHPLDYQTFEGLIPKGEYGGGQVIVWDRGTYEHVSAKPGPVTDMRSAIEAGHFTVMLHGEKLIGQWSLIRTGEANGKDQWVMIKHKDDYVNAELDITKERPESVVSGRTIDDLKVEQKRTTSGAKQASTAQWAEPMLASLAKTSPTGSNWTFERKLDGLRCIAVRNRGQVELWSRNHLSFNARFPTIVKALADLPIDDFVFDGELVAFDTSGRTSFSLLQQGHSSASALHVFDVVHLLGQDTRKLPLSDRRKLLAQAFSESDSLKVVVEEKGTPDALFAQACKRGWEGLVAKRLDSAYTAGRSTNWLKLKCTASQELVVAGWTEPHGTRVGFGALLMGYYTGDTLHYAGKVGTGFNAELLTTLHAKLLRLERKTSPFVEAVKEKDVHWAKPELVANITFSEWTNDGRLRHPSFSGLRPDKNASEVRREQ